MNLPMAHLKRTLRRRRMVLSVLVAAAVTACFALPRPGIEPAPAEQAAMHPLVHWKDASHDWLLVADTQADQIMVYDAQSGKPLRRLDQTDGLADVDGLSRQGARLAVLDRTRHRTQWLSLPQLQPVDLAAR